MAILMGFLINFQRCFVNSDSFHHQQMPCIAVLKDSASFGYCSGILCILGWSKNLLFLKENAYQFEDIFAWFLNMQENKVLARANFKSKKKIGVTTYFPEMIKLQFVKKYHTLLCIFGDSVG